MTENGGFRPLSKKVFMQSNSNLVCTLIGWVFRIDSRYQKKYLCNPIQTWCVHLLGECSELICFWAMLAKFWPSSGHKMNQICGFWLLSEKVFTQYNSNLVSTLVWWVHNWFAFGPCWSNLGPLVAKKLMKLGENGCFWPSPAKLSTQPNRMAWQWAETLVEIRATLADIRGSTK